MKSSTIKTIGMVIFIVCAVLFLPACFIATPAAGFACLFGGITTYINLLIMATIIEHLEILSRPIRQQMPPPKPEERPFLKD